MRFLDGDESLLDVFQPETHLVNETWAGSAKAAETMLRRAVGREGYFGFLGTHDDFSDGYDVELMKVATDLDVPMVSVEQVLEWTQGREHSRIRKLRWDAGVLVFEVRADDRTRGMLTVLLPLRSVRGALRDDQGSGDALLTGGSESHSAHHGS